MLIRNDHTEQHTEKLFKKLKFTQETVTPRLQELPENFIFFLPHLSVK